MLYEGEAVCLVCGRPLGPDAHLLTGRAYCTKHLAELSQDRPGLWRATGGLMVSSFILVILSLLGNLILPPPPGSPFRLLIGLVQIVFPALVWLFFVYWQEARAGSALSAQLFALLVLGGLVGLAIGRPLLTGALAMREWLPTARTSTRLLENILLVGFTHIALIYAVVRYVVWRTPAFARRTDGPLYAVGVGLGYATMLNLIFLLEEGGLDPVNGAFRFIDQTAAHLSASVVLGFYLGRNRFADLPAWYLPSGVGLAALVDGFMLYASAELNNTRLGLTRDAFSPWPGAIFSMLGGLIAFSAIYGIQRRVNSGPESGRESAA
jgi:RsiW-degrading membrane proteinase PrsW (M82 family)